jgi:hypothetical protein
VRDNIAVVRGIERARLPAFSRQSVKWLGDGHSEIFVKSDRNYDTFPTRFGEVKPCRVPEEYWWRCLRRR